VSDETILETLRLADTFLPVGTFTVSYGLEQFVQADRVTDATDLEGLLAAYLESLIGPGELVALRAAHAAAEAESLDALCRADRHLHATTLAAEFRESATRSGRRLLRLQREGRDDELLEVYAARVPEEAPGAYPVVLGASTAGQGVPAQHACLLHCHAFVTGLLGAAQRLMSLGHTEAQRILTDLQPTMSAAVAASADRSLEEMTPFAPLADVLAAEHERAERRLFVS
jgi:urease accessory protein